MTPSRPPLPALAPLALTLSACSDAARWSAAAALALGALVSISLTLHRLWRWDAELSVEWSGLGARGQAERSANRIPRPLRARYLSAARAVAAGAP